MMTEESMIPPPVFQDRKPLLAVLGILQIFMAALSIVGAVLVSANLMLVENKFGSFFNPLRVIILRFFFSGLFMVWFIWMGIGSVKARRWARALSLAFSRLWLFGGVIGTIVFFFWMGDWFEVSIHAADWYKWMMDILQIITAALVLIFLIFIPIMFITFYSRNNIKMTCEFYDREVRWTDKCPIAVLVLVIVFGFLGLCFLGMLFYSGIAPFFGSLVGGTAGIIIFLVMAALCGYLAWGMQRLDAKSWWVAVIYIIAVSISTIMTFYKMGLQSVCFVTIYPDQLEFVEKHMYSKSGFDALYGSWAIPMLGYLLFVRKYFVRQK